MFLYFDKSKVIPLIKKHLASNGVLVTSHFSWLPLYDEPIRFTREEWRGRMRACRGIGAALSPEAVEAFDQEHESLLKKLGKDEFTVLHRIDAHLMTSKY